MLSLLATPEENEACAAAALRVIEARLADLPDGEQRAYWQAVAARYIVNDEDLAAEANKDLRCQTAAAAG